MCNCVNTRIYAFRWLAVVCMHVFCVNRLMFYFAYFFVYFFIIIYDFTISICIVYTKIQERNPSNIRRSNKEKTTKFGNIFLYFSDVSIAFFFDNFFLFEHNLNISHLSQVKIGGSMSTQNTLLECRKVPKFLIATGLL